MSSVVIKSGSETVSGGSSVVTFDASFTSLPTVICTPKLKDINIYVENITTSEFTVKASSNDEFVIDYIAIQE